MAADRDCPGLGAGRRRLPLVGAHRGAADAPRAAARGFPRLVRRLPARPRGGHAAQPLRARLRLRPRRTARSPISTASTSAAPGAGAASPTRSTRTWPGSPAATADEHLDASLPHVAGDYMGEHWLATFALLALGYPPRHGEGDRRRRRGGGVCTRVRGQPLHQASAAVPLPVPGRNGIVGMVYKSLPR